jgi:hypothetical protein
MRFLAVLSLLFCLCLALPAQNAPSFANSQTIRASGSSITVTPPNWATTAAYAAFQENVFGSPASITIIITGCTYGGGSCTQADSHTSSGSSVTSRSLTSPTYAYYKVSATWTGGVNVFVTVNSLIFGQTVAYPTPGGGSGSVTSVGLSGTSNQICISGSSPIIASGGWTLSICNPFNIPSMTVGSTGTAGLLTFYDTAGTSTTLASPTTANGNLLLNGTALETTVNGAACAIAGTCNGNWNAGSLTSGHLATWDGTNGELQDGGAVPVSPTSNQNIRTIIGAFGDFTSTASALSASAQACTVVPFAGSISKVQLIATPSGSVTVDVRTVAYASYTGPSSTSTITASDTPALSSATSYSDSTLTGWTTTVTANSVFCFYLTSPSTVTGVEAVLTVAAN